MFQEFLILAKSSGVVNKLASSASVDRLLQANTAPHCSNGPGFLLIVSTVQKPNLYFCDVQIQLRTFPLMRKKPLALPLPNYLLLP